MIGVAMAFLHASELGGIASNLLAFAKFLKGRHALVLEHLIEQLVPHRRVRGHIFIVSKRGAPAIGARAPKMPLERRLSGCALAVERAGQAASERRGEGEPVLDRRSAPSHLGPL